VLYQTDVRPPQFLRVSPDGKLIAYFEMGEIGDFNLFLIGPLTPSSFSPPGGEGSAVWRGLRR